MRGRLYALAWAPVNAPWAEMAVLGGADGRPGDGKLADSPLGVPGLIGRLVGGGWRRVAAAPTHGPDGPAESQRTPRTLDTL